MQAWYASTAGLAPTAAQLIQLLIACNAPEVPPTVEAANKPTPQTSAPGKTPEPPPKEVTPANAPPAKVPSGPVAKSTPPEAGKP
jgi:hypothetical protein